MPSVSRNVHSLKLSLIGLVICLPFCGRAEDVTITQRVPIEKLDSDGHPAAVSMAQAGARYTFVRQDGSNLVLQDDGGIQYQIEMAATSYTPPAAAPVTTTAAQTNAGPVAATPPPAAVTNASSASAPTPAAVTENLSPGDADKIKQVNDMLGIPLLADTGFWQDDVTQVAKRLQWPQESQTSTQESYRRYAISTPVTILGASANSMALYGKDGKPTYISIVFANAGDFPEARKMDPLSDDATVAKVTADLAVAVKKDSDTLTEKLTGLLGNPSTTLYGNSSSNRDEVHRWDWNDVAILLNSHNGEYASIKIIPTDAADHFGTTEVTDRDAMRDLLAQRVVKRDNGDVILSEVPMVDQGPKGYCVPATWERYLRYMDVPADLYVLAIMGHTGFGGGTSFREMEEGVDDYVSAYHRRIETYNAPFDITHMSKYIDQGLPLMWTCWVTRAVEIQTTKNSLERKTVTDWSKYADEIKAEDAALGNIQAANDNHSNGHMRLIIGYNATTNEIAISDSWGAAAAERWLYIGTAAKINQAQIDYLSW